MTTTPKFQLLLNGLRPRRSEDLDWCLERIAAAASAGAIPNADYVRVKETVNRILEEAWDASARSVLRAMRHTGRNSAVDDVYLLGDLMVHTVASHLKRVSALPEGDLRTGLMALMEEAIPLSASVTALAKMSVKRQPKPPVEVVVGYRPPRVSNDTQRRIVALLEELTDAAYLDLKSDHSNRKHAMVARFLQMASEQSLEPNDGPCEVYTRQYGAGGRGLGNRSVLDAVARSSSVIQPYVLRRKRGAAFETRPDLDVFIAAESERYARAVQTEFVAKNFRKLASIVEAKDNMSSATVTSRFVSLTGLEGRLRFEFEDGSSFEADNSLVYAVSVNGKPFNRFPLTFRSVFMPDGTKMHAPSEERMNEEFAVATVAVMSGPR